MGFNDSVLDINGSPPPARTHTHSHEFKEALKAAELGLTRKDINLILSHIDVDRDGLVSYEEFIPVCFQVGVRVGGRRAGGVGAAAAGAGRGGAGCKQSGKTSFESVDWGSTGSVWVWAR